MTRTTIARYEIKSEIGRGGMATVYLAYDPNFRRNVAIKLISGNLQENRVFRERFEREAHLIAKIEHPAIVPVYDYGEQDDQLFLVMRYMPGGSLADRIKEEVLTLGESARIISQIAPALDAVHVQGVVHRDLKPGNILLDNFGNAAISDFGIAHLTATTTDLTGSAIIGTPSYMSPEQVRGEMDLDGRSDIYALGVIVFEMLTGRGPFQAGTPMSMALKHLSEPLPSIRSFRADLPVELESILNKALAKDRTLRHASASELAQDLQTVSVTFQDKDTHPSPVLLQHGEDIPTEVDMGEGSQQSIHSHGAPQTGVSQPTPRFAESIKQPSAQTERPGLSLRRNLKIGLFVSLALLLFIFCSSIGLFGAWAGLGLPGLSPEQTRTISPTRTAGDPGSLENSILFADDFTDPGSGWPSVQNAQGSYGYQPDGYHIFVNAIDQALWAKTNREDGNVSIYVDAAPVTPDANGYFGLLCRVQDNQNFYYFVIQNNGNYTMGKFKNGEFQPFSNWMQSGAIRQGNQTNRLESECLGNKLRFYVNNILLGEMTDADFGSGFSGVIAAALNAQGFEARFNNFLIMDAGQ
jgi:serine/threonine protein kinase